MEIYRAEFRKGEMSYRFTLSDGKYEVTMVRDKGEPDIEIWLRVDGGRQLMPTSIPVKELLKGFGITKEDFE